jgi:hypothetical protein
MRARRHDNINFSLVMYEAMRTRRKGERKVLENKSVGIFFSFPQTIVESWSNSLMTRELKIYLGQRRLFWLPTNKRDFDLSRIAVAYLVASPNTYPTRSR